MTRRPPGHTPSPPAPDPDGAARTRYLRIIAVATVFASLVLGAVVLHQLEGVFRPLFIALFLCYLLWPMVGALTRRGVPRWLAYVLSFAFLFGAMYAVAQLVALNTDGFTQNLPKYRENLGALLKRANDWAVSLHMLSAETPLTLQTIDQWMPAKTIAEALGSGTSFFFSFLGTLAVVVFFMIFILLEAEYLPARIRQANGPERAEVILSTLRDINHGIRRYVGLKFILSTVTAVLATVVMAQFGLDFYYLWGTLAFFANFIPYLGSIIATAIPVTLALVQFSSPIDALWLMLALTAVQLGIGNLLEPQLQGRNLNLSPLVILVALAVWGWLWGIVGMILAIPMTVALRIAMEHSTHWKKYAILLSNQHSEGVAK